MSKALYKNMVFKNFLESFGAYSSWSTMKNSEANRKMEIYRTTKMPIPQIVPNPFPATYSFTDYTNAAIERLNARGRFMTMDEIENMSPPTFAMQEAIRNSLKSGRDGGIIGAPSGFGKTYVYRYLGTLAAERALTHPFLWFRGNNFLREEIEKRSNVREWHFMFADSKIALGQTRRYVGTAEEAEQQLREAVARNPQTFVVCLDELYTGITTGGQNALGGWYQLKGLTGDEGLIKMIGSMASKDVSLFEKLRVTYDREGGAGAGGGGGEERQVYDEQIQRRFHKQNVPDYTKEEQLSMLMHGGIEAFCNNPRKNITLKFEQKDKDSIIRNLIDSAGRIRGAFGAPSKFEEIISEAKSEFIDIRFEKYKDYIEYGKKLKTLEDTVEWSKELSRLKQEKSGLANECNVNTKETNSKDLPITPESPISYREVGIKFPEYKPLKGESVSETACEQVEDIEQKEKEISEKIKNIEKIRRRLLIKIQKGKNELNSEYGEGAFKDDFSDLNYLKPFDISNVNIDGVNSHLVSAEREERGEDTE